jgi:hypothetical protein
MSRADNDTVLWALVCAAYHLERVVVDGPTDIENIRKLLGKHDPKTVSLYFLKAALTFDPPISLEAAQALYEHYGIEAVGLEKMYPAQKPQ